MYIDLNLLFELLDRVPNIGPMLIDLEAYILSEGLMVMRLNSETITSVHTNRRLLRFVWMERNTCFCFCCCLLKQKDPEKYVDQLLELFNRFTKLVDDAFKGDPRFMSSRDKAFKSIVNDTTIFQMDLPATNQKA